MNIRQVQDKDIPRITEIYNWYILNTTITFEAKAISFLEMKKGIQEKIEKYDWLVGEFNQEVIGYAYYCSLEEIKQIIFQLPIQE